MTINREAIFTALFNLLQNNVTGCMTYTRRPVMWDQMPAAAKPAIILMQVNQGYDYQNESTPAKLTMTAKILVYTAAADDPEAIPVTQMNNILDAIDAALAPSPVTGKQTLGGLVSHCRIEGQSNPLDDGSLDNQGVAVLTVKIFLPVTGT